MISRTTDSTSDPDARRLLIIDALDMDDMDAIDIILSGLSDSSPKVREEAAKAIGDFPGEHMIEPLLLLLDDPDEAVRKAASNTLADCNQVKLLDYLDEYLKDKSSFVRSSILRAVKPLYIADAGHSGSQTPQSMQTLGSITKKFFPSWKQSTGQTSTQSIYLQLTQLSVTT